MKLSNKLVINVYVTDVKKYTYDTESNIDSVNKLIKIVYKAFLTLAYTVFPKLNDYNTKPF